PYIPPTTNPTPSPFLVAPVQPPNNTPPTQGIYTLGGGDNIRIDIFDLPQLSGQYQIPAGGTIQMPLIGGISVQGLTLQEAANNISAAYSSILKRPIITVSLSAARPMNIWISGEVNRPGSYSIPLTSGAGNVPSVQFPTLVQALERAQGVTLSADIRRIQLRRRPGNSPEQLLTFNLWEYLQTGQVSSDITLRDGDTIFVPPTININLAEARQLNETSFGPPADQPRSVSVLGAVNRPGSYVVIGGNTTIELRNGGLPTVSRAIQLAGGIRVDADLRNVQIRRATKTAGLQIFNVNLWELLQTGDPAQDTLVQNGDTIVVSTATDLSPAEVSFLGQSSLSPSVVLVTVVGEVNRPGPVQVPANTSLNQAILAAGGIIQSRAKTDSIDLIRLNRDGTVSRRTLSLDLGESLNEQTNPIVSNNDVIFVKSSRSASLVDALNLGFSPSAAVLGGVTIPSRIIELLRLLGL
ncbi:MAG TPA: SLBB domain-containing protein, partial [Halomicronema sp.]